MSNGIPHTYAANQFATNPKYRARCKESAIDWAKANKSDPNAFNKCMNDFRSGIAYAGPVGRPLWTGAEGYSLEWRQEERSYEANGETVWYTVKVPTSMKTP